MPASERRALTREAWLADFMEKMGCPAARADVMSASSPPFSLSLVVRTASAPCVSAIKNCQMCPEVHIERTPAPISLSSFHLILSMRLVQCCVRTVLCGAARAKAASNGILSAQRRVCLRFLNITKK